MSTRPPARTTHSSPRRASASSVPSGARARSTVSHASIEPPLVRAAPPGEHGRSFRPRGYTLAFPGGFAAHSRVAGSAPGGKKRSGAEGASNDLPVSDPKDTQAFGAVVLTGEAAGVTGAEAGREPPVRIAARAAVDAGLWPVAVVVRRDAEETRAALAGLPVATTLDDAPRPDRATGIRRGLARLRECAPGLGGVMVLDAPRPRRARRTWPRWPPRSTPGVGPSPPPPGTARWGSRPSSGPRSSPSSSRSRAARARPRCWRATRARVTPVAPTGAPGDDG